MIKEQGTNTAKLTPLNATVLHLTLWKSHTFISGFSSQLPSKSGQGTHWLQGTEHYKINIAKCHYAIIHFPLIIITIPSTQTSFSTVVPIQLHHSHHFQSKTSFPSELALNHTALSSETTWKSVYCLGLIMKSIQQ